MPVTALPSDTSTLASAAFGARPDLFPLPPGGDRVASWHRAVALGGQGRYAAARAELTRLRRATGPDGALASLAASTEASLLRQLGRHREAAVLDGRAAAALADAPRYSSWTVEARCDALTGLAADALGCGRIRPAVRLLDRCAAALDAAEGVHGAVFRRQRVRLHWVCAETALASGDFATARRRSAAAAAEAERSGSVRHLVKSDLLRAASWTGESDLTPARDLCLDVLDRSTALGLVPLRWAAAMLWDGLGGGEAARRVRDESAALVVRRGGRFATIRV
ncbi:hypothetical protein D092_20140 [Rhodococcus ruber Chol-4]|uniref:hypothetical protein n=1 Tax=Rhodococcus TaxID=1827 RepID=UPI00029AFEFC|nr:MULTISPECIES: hypothetical protein [Rhodococcus]MDO2379726.1 hypothetical protein [Rhodococcus ruber]RIK09969.1 MAG: hypothetical protein DCC47_13180 [Acidobacteriota bacterium]ATQ28568.1 hypothetical protein CS378_07450 [Rhodococcus ruber]AUM17596.1 hypothetical protein CSW53_14380 [Rhodococcus ruber]AWG99978.1 hypothetical protein DCN13_16250 [Rhodococcus ruber]